MGIEKQTPLLKIEDLEVIYTTGGDTIHAVNKVSFQVDRGKVLALVGETGAGKTSIARTILRILPVPPAKIRGGKVFFDGEDLLHLDEKEMQKVRGKRISMIFQDPMTALNPVVNVREQIIEAITLHEDVTREEAVAKANDMLRLVGISSDRGGEYPHQFSGGMKQRIVIAMALACNPELLLADEPTTALDVTIQAQVLEQIRDLREKYNTAMILITHDLGVVAQNCDDVAIVYAGEIVEIGSKEDIFIRTAHPYTIGLFGTVPTLDSDDTELKTIPGMMPNPADLPDGCHFHPRCPFASEECKTGAIPLVQLSDSHYCRCCHITEVRNSNSEKEDKK